MDRELYMQFTIAYKFGVKTSFSLSSFLDISGGTEYEGEVCNSTFLKRRLG